MDTYPALTHRTSDPKCIIPFSDLVFRDHACARLAPLPQGCGDRLRVNLPPSP